jgi:hypothetical protein
MLADAVESKLVGGDFESGVGKLYRFDFILLFDQHIVHAIAPLADEMLMSIGERIETLQSPLWQHLQFFVEHEFL